MTETTHHPAALHAYFGYRDAHAAIEWLGRAFGFETTMQFPDDADIDAVHARALDAGATGVWEPGTSEWGNHRCRVLDPEGAVIGELA